MFETTSRPFMILFPGFEVTSQVRTEILLYLLLHAHTGKRFYRVCIVQEKLAHYRFKANPWSTKYSSGDDIEWCGICVHHNLDRCLVYRTSNRSKTKSSPQPNKPSNTRLIHILLFHQRIYPIELSPSALVCRATWRGKYLYIVPNLVSRLSPNWETRNQAE